MGAVNQPVNHDDAVNQPVNHADAVNQPVNHADAVNQPVSYLIFHIEKNNYYISNYSMFHLRDLNMLK